jgi:predicted nucleic acid-binding protein
MAVKASALAALLFGEPDARGVAERLDGAASIAPALLDLELASVRVGTCRRHAAQHDLLRSGYQLRGLSDIGIVPVDHSDLLDVAARTGLTAYDSSCVWVARTSQAEPVTSDRQLETACKP